MDILADVVLDLSVDEVVCWEEPSEAVEPFALHRLVSTSPADMARAWPQVWRNIKAADRTIARARAWAKQKDISLYSNYLIGKCPFAAEVVYRRAATNAKRVVAFVDLRTWSNPLEGLVKTLGGAFANALEYVLRRRDIPPLAGSSTLALDATVAPAKLPWSTPVVEEIRDPVLVRQILAEAGEPVPWSSPLVDEVVALVQCAGWPRGHGP